VSQHRTSPGIARVVGVTAVAMASLLAGHAAYRGHANDADINALLAPYPALKGTAIDSCATCHRKGHVPDADRPGASRRENHCEFCHVVYVRNKGAVRDTLNLFGAAYLAAGRNAAAVKAMAQRDADGDGVSNEVEMMKGTNPGDPETNPSLPIAPRRGLSLADMGKLVPAVSEVLLLNTATNPGGDSYNSYRGFRLNELLQAVGVSDAADSIDFISLDGFERTHTLDELKRVWPQGAPVLGLGKAELGSCGFTTYSVKGLDGAKPLPSAGILLAFEENGSRIASAAMDPKTGRIVGTGPLRLVVPQFHVSPPDLFPSADKSCVDKVAPEYRYHEDYDHNGGKSAFSIVAVRVNPLPKGTRDVEWEKLADQNISREEIVFFGALTGTGVH
jgi:hypothetical protein